MAIPIEKQPVLNDPSSDQYQYFDRQTVLPVSGLVPAYQDGAGMPSIEYQFQNPFEAFQYSR
jgi:hypothetical protein